jgi:hypothetical protein
LCEGLLIERIEFFVEFFELALGFSVFLTDAPGFTVVERCPAAQHVLCFVESDVH